MFRTWTKKSWVFFVFRDSYVIYIWVMKILCTFHIFVYVYVTTRRANRWGLFEIISYEKYWFNMILECSPTCSRVEGWPRLKWTQLSEFKTWTWLFTFHIELIILGTACHYFLSIHGQLSQSIVLQPTNLGNGKLLIQTGCRRMVFWFDGISTLKDYQMPNPV